MKSIKICLIKLAVCLLVLTYALYAAKNQMTFDVIAFSVLSCRYFAILCVECLYARIDRINQLTA